MASSKSPSFAISESQLARGVLIDFEGTMTDPATFLGVLYGGEWEARILESVFYKVPITHPLGKVSTWKPMDALRQIMDLSISEERPLLAWSTRELDAILSLGSWTETEKEWWKRNVINVLPPAKAWAKKNSVVIPTIPGIHGPKENKWSLSGFRKATGYPEFSRQFDVGNTASRIRYVRNQLLAKGEFELLTPVAKRKWSSVLTHNYHDCCGLAHVAKVVFLEVSDRHP